MGTHLHAVALELYKVCRSTLATLEVLSLWPSIPDEAAGEPIDRKRAAKHVIRLVGTVIVADQVAAQMKVDLGRQVRSRFARLRHDMSELIGPRVDPTSRELDAGDRAKAIFNAGFLQLLLPCEGNVLEEEHRAEWLLQIQRAEILLPNGIPITRMDSEMQWPNSSKLSGRMGFSSRPPRHTQAKHSRPAQLINQP
jgi:hypothetical protein